MTAPACDRKHVTLYTDGGCSGNPGPGGWGVVLVFGKHRKELSGGCRLTTNNRMEILAVIRGLEALKEPCKVTIVSDSQYVVNAMSQGWARAWRAKGWRRSGGGKAENPDLWERLLELCEGHDAAFTWVRGHASTPGNTRADELAVAAYQSGDLAADEYYERNVAGAA